MLRLKNSLTSLANSAGPLTLGLASRILRLCSCFGLLIVPAAMWWSGSTRPTAAQAGFEMNAFGAFGALAGLALAALSFLLGAKDAPALKPVSQDDPQLWNSLLSSVLVALVSWLAAASAAIAHWAVPGAGTWLLFVGLASMSTLEGWRAVLWVAVAVGRFTATPGRR